MENVTDEQVDKCINEMLGNYRAQFYKIAKEWLEGIEKGNVKMSDIAKEKLKEAVQRYKDYLEDFNLNAPFFTRQ